MADIPALTTEQMIEVDRAMIEDYGIQLLQMMENAGRCLAHLARERFGDVRGKPINVLAGTGGNGGGAMVAARRLHIYGADVSVVLTKPNLDGVPGHQHDILRHMSIPIYLPDTISNVPPTALILDGIIGYSLKGAPYGPAADLIRWANKSDTPVLALDVPSGVETSSGTILDPAIRAAATLTLALPKTGLEAAASHVGELWLADISVPPAVYAALGIEVGPIFAESDVIRVEN